jgi:hypothetical protein
MTNFHRKQRRAKIAAIAESFAIALLALALAYIAFTLPLAL